MRHNEILLDLGLSDYNPVTFGYETCSPRHSYGPAVRSYWLIHYINSGKGSFTREGKTFNLSGGDLFVIPPYLETYYEADSTDPWSYVWIGFDSNENVSAFLQKPILHCPEAKHIFEEMKLCELKKFGKTEFLLAKLWEFFSMISANGKDHSSYTEIAIQYMKNEYMNPISVSELAKRLGLDRSYFSNIFKKQFGISPGKYLSNLRLSNAAELLTKHGMSPTTAAFSCGFTDIYHFSKAFKKQFGLSPRAYKEENKKKTSIK
ncbi:MAG: AraC family transcriptional regulator [Ruminococcaceae bacterium]|nr:AraC family transcriptional regulator [Oscillospiraceae bacterium]